MKRRTVAERVEEYKGKKGYIAKITGDEFTEIAQMFGPFLNFCDAFKIVNTAFYLGYIKGSGKKGGVA